MRDSIETRLGMFFALAIIAALVILESLGTFAFLKRGYHLFAAFKNVQELKVGDDVKMGGVPVGRVEKIELTNAAGVVKALVTMNLDQKLTNGVVKTDSIATIRFTGLMGQNYVTIDFGTPGAVVAADGDTLNVLEPHDLSEIMTKLDSVADGVQNLTKSFSGEQIDKLFGPLTEFVKNNQSNLGLTIGNVKTISDRISRGEGTVGLLINNPDLYNNMLTTVSNLQQTAPEFKQAAADARALMANLNGVVDQAKAGQGTIGKLLTDDSLFRTASDTMTNLDQIMIKVNTGDGTVSQLINTNSAMRDIKLTLQKVEKATDSLEDTGPLSVLGTLVGSLF